MDQRNVQWQSRFAALVRELRARSTLSIRKDLEKRMELSLFRFLFVPGFHYRTDPSSGADFAGPRTYLRNCGFDTQLVEVEEDGTIEQNAAFIAAAVRKETSAGKRLVIVSTSIGGPETAVALGKLLSVDDLRPVAAWISVGGLLGGTVLADQAERWPIKMDAFCRRQSVFGGACPESLEIRAITVPQTTGNSLRAGANYAIS